MLQPKRTKYRKQQKGRSRGMVKGGGTVSFGEYGLRALERGRFTARQIEAARRAISRYMKRAGKLWVKVFPDKPITKKPLEVRQGKGKGSVDCWVDEVKPGRILFEVAGVSPEIVQEAFRLAAGKLPFKVVVVKRETM